MFSPGNWKNGKVPDSVVTDQPFRGVDDIGARDYYGGYLICESATPGNQALIRCAPDMYELRLEIKQEYEAGVDDDSDDDADNPPLSSEHYRRMVALLVRASGIGN